MTSLLDGPRRPLPNLVQKLYYGWYRWWLSNPRFLRRRAARGPRRVVLGCSGEYQPGWLPTDYDWLNLLIPEHWTRYFEESSVRALMAEHVWEHLTRDEAVRAARQCFRYLEPGGHLRVAVPDGNHPDAGYIEFVGVGGSGPGSDDHKVLYTHDTFRAVFEEAGFVVELLEWFDEDHEFHAVDWDRADGLIVRSRRYDGRNADGELRYTSLILDAKKPVEAREDPVEPREA